MDGLGEIVSEEFDKIDESILKKKRAIAYVADVVRANYNSLQEIFGEKEGTDRDRHLYDMTLKTIKEVGQFCEAIGVSGYTQLNPDDLPAVVRLGWVNVENMDKPGPEYNHWGYPTEEGFRILNGYRDTLGLMSVQERNQRERELTFKHMERPEPA